MEIATLLFATMMLKAMGNTGIVGMTGAIMDAGIVSQNISIFCSAANLATVPRASMDNNQLKKVLKLKDTQVPMMNHPLGYFK